MAIITFLKDDLPDYQYLNIYPDQFISEKEKEKPEFLKTTMDYFANRAYAQYTRSRETFVKNYDLMKGILRTEDFYAEPEVKSFTDLLEQDLDLPKYVQHFSIMSAPINSLVGEMTKRPDTYKVKAFDDESKSEELAFRTELLQKFVMDNAKMKILQKAQLLGEDEIPEEELQKMAYENVKDELDDYTSVAEKWANKIIEALRMEFRIKEQAEEGVKDLALSGREFWHLYEDNSKIGFNLVEENPKNVWYLTTPDMKYISDPSGRANGAYAAGTIKVMEISQIIEENPDITIEEIEHLRKALQDYGLVNVRESNLGNSNVKPGINSIIYDTYDPLVMHERMIMESEMQDNNDELNNFLGYSNNVSAFGYKYVVITAYWFSKKKIAKVEYEENGVIQSMIVDDSYVSGTIPTEISIEWAWINQIYQGRKIGPDIYHIKPFKLLSYLPIIGMLNDVKNTQEIRSIFDMMKPFQVIYNICMNQLYRLLEKEIGVVASINNRRIPKLKDGDDQDALEVLKMEMREEGIMLDDDSPENTKGGMSNTTIARAVDLSRGNEIQSRYNLAVTIRNECWELAGFARQRLAVTQASESATGVNAAVNNSYTQTEAWSVAHEYLMGMVYQGVIDAAQYVTVTNEESTLSFVNSEGKSAFINVSGADIKFRDLKQFPTNRPEDTQAFNEIRQLAQPILQNGGTIYDVIEVYSTKSIREMKKTFKDLHDQQKDIQEREMAYKEQQLEQAREATQMQILEERAEKEKDRLNENHQKNLDRLNKTQVALINALGRNENATADTDNSGLADALEITRQTSEINKSQQAFNVSMREIALRERELNENTRIKEEQIKVDRENQQNDLRIAKENAKGRKSSGTKK